MLAVLRGMEARRAGLYPALGPLRLTKNTLLREGSARARVRFKSLQDLPENIASETESGTLVA